MYTPTFVSFQALPWCYGVHQAEVGGESVPCFRVRFPRGPVAGLLTQSLVYSRKAKEAYGLVVAAYI